MSWRIEEFFSIDLPARYELRALESGQMSDWRQRVISDPEVCHGKPCIRGTRIMVSVILDNVAEGLQYDDVVREYPPLTLEDVYAALSYAAALTREEELVPLR